MANQPKLDRGLFLIVVALLGWAVPGGGYLAIKGRLDLGSLVAFPTVGAPVFKHCLKALVPTKRLLLLLV